ncbi:MAG: Ig-like domain-containing protein [Candidatus Bathycorpusculaceae bacterium]
MGRNKKGLQKTILIILLFFTVFGTQSYCIPESYTRSYQLLNEPGGTPSCRLNITVQQSLYDYYIEKSHKLSTNTDFAKFVTPFALQPVADRLWEIYGDDEDFANGVLTIVHQIPYVETLPAKYPVETIVENRGDCDLFSYVAASIINAGGLDVILLYYENEAHMNIGVNLSHAPYDARGQAYYVLYNNVKYYVAECTGGNLQTGWRIGEMPDDLREASVQVITLENCEQWAPGQVSATYKTLELSTISLTASSMFVLQGWSVTFYGQLSPTLQNESITIYAKINNSPWIVLGTATTDSGGNFKYLWTAEAAGICYVRASWSGNEDYAGADSSTQTLTVISVFLILLLTVSIALACIGLAIYLTARRAKHGTLEPQPPQIPEIPS